VTTSHVTCGDIIKQSNIYTSVCYVLQSQKVATRYANNKIHKEAVKIDINATTDIQNSKMIKHEWG